MFEKIRLPGKVDTPEVWVEFVYNNATVMIKYNISTKEHFNLFGDSSILDDPIIKEKFEEELDILIMERKIAKF